MQCPRCHAENREGRRFCAKCAAPLATVCPSCGFSNEPGEDFCGGCAAPLAAPSRPAEARFASPQSYTPKHLAEKILTSKGALEGERKQVTVLFADLKGSMELLADRDPEEARKLLDPVLERMMEAVHRYEGTVNQVMGDGIMALFGAPLAHEDHAVRACYAALDLQAALRRYAEEVRRTQGVKLQIRVGLNSGEVVVRAVGSDLRMDYSAVGQTTHLAARMEQLADPGSSLLTADTLHLAEGFVEVKALGPVPVKGVDVPIEVYELLGAGPLRSRLQAAAARGLTRFVGREGELEQLRGALGQAAEGRGQVVAIVGEPGVGKSRLVWEITHSHRTQGWRIVESSSVSYGKATAYLPVIDLLKAYFKIQDRDDQREIREKVTGKVLTLDDALKASMAAFLGLLDVPVDDLQWQALDPPQRRQRTLNAVKRLLLRESQVQPLLVVFEDLHWIDSETQALLDSLVDSLPTARILLLTNYRPEYQHAWGSRTYYTQVRLDPLAAESAQALLHGLLGEHPEVRPLKTLLIERTEGNPFFLEEAVRTLVETKTLSGERGAYRVAQPVEQIQVPSAVQAILAARIDRLPSDEKRLLQAAAVIGKDVPDAILLAIADRPEADLRRDLAHLQAAEFLYETSLFPDLEYTFKHALTHDVAYGSLLQTRRRELHARIVQAIEGLYRDRLAEHVERLAHHAVRGELWEQAVGALVQAGAKAMGRAALREAVGSFEQALDALEHVAITPEHLDRGIDVRLSLRNALYMLGEHERVLEHLRHAERLATARGERRRLVRVLGYLSSHFVFTEVFDEALTYGVRALSLAQELGDGELEIEMAGRVALVQVISGDYAQTVERLRALLPRVIEELPSPRFFGVILTVVMVMGPLAQALAELGEFDEALRLALEAIRRAEQLDPRYSLAAACLWAGRVHLRRGDLGAATWVLERSVDIARAVNAATALPLAASHLGLAYALAGRDSDARPLLEEAVDKGAQGWEQSLHLVMLAEGHFLAGRMAQAHEVAERAFRRAREHRERGSEALAVRLLGEIALRCEESAAEEHLHVALALSGQLGMRPLVAHCQLGLGKLYRRTGNRAKADEHLTTAATMYREMDMTFWLEKAKAAQGSPSESSP